MGLFAIFDMKIVLFYLIHSIENGMNSFSTIINDGNVAPAIAVACGEAHDNSFFRAITQNYNLSNGSRSEVE